MKKLSISILTIAAAVAVLTTTAMAQTYSYSSHNVYENISGDFSITDSYHYSSEDKTGTKHTLIFTIGKTTAVADAGIISLDEAPYIDNGRTMLPIRAVIEAFATFSNESAINWNSINKQVTVNYMGNTAVFTVGSQTYTLNGETKTIDGAVPVNKNGRVFLPLRVVAESMGITVDWNGDAQTVTLTN